MKKILVIAMCGALVASFTACGDSSSESTAEVEEVVVEPEETTEEEEADAEEALDEAAEDTTTTEDAETITTTYDGMTFSYPSDCEYEESDDYATITFEESKEFINIMPYGELEEDDDSTISTGDWLEVYLLGYLSAFDNVSNEQSFDLTIAGCEAKGITAICTYNSNMVSFSGIAVCSDQHDAYGIYYNCTSDAEGRTSDYEEFLDSISFGEATTADDEITETSEENNSSVKDIEGGNTFFEDPLEIEAVPTEDGRIALFITNTGDDTVGQLKIQINYKDDSGATIDLDSDLHDVILPGSTVVSRMDAPDTYADYDIEADIDVDANPKYENHAADVEINSNVGDDSIIIEITNNYDETIEEIEYDVVLYKDGNIVTITYPKDVYDVEPGQTVTEKENLYGKEFDDYEIYLNQAHNFNIGS